MGLTGVSGFNGAADGVGFLKKGFLGLTGVVSGFNGAADGIGFLKKGFLGLTGVSGIGVVFIRV